MCPCLGKIFGLLVSQGRAAIFNARRPSQGFRTPHPNSLLPRSLLDFPSPEQLLVTEVMFPKLSEEIARSLFNRVVEASPRGRRRCVYGRFVFAIVALAGGINCRYQALRATSRFNELRSCAIARPERLCRIMRSAYGRARA